MTQPETWLKQASGYWPIGILFCFALAGSVYGVAPAILVLAASLLVVALVLAWMSLGELANEEPLTLEEALELAAPERREQEKLSILRGLKDLEQEHRFGKISDAEFAAESERMRQQAKRLLSSLDDSVKARRTSVEDRIRRFLKDKPATKRQPAPAPKPTTQAQEEP